MPTSQVKWVWLTLAGDDKIERTEGVSFSLFIFFEPQKKLPHKSILNCKAFLSFTPWLSLDMFAYSAGAKARMQAGSKEK